MVLSSAAASHYHNKTGLEGKIINIFRARAHADAEWT